MPNEQQDFGAEPDGLGDPPPVVADEPRNILILAAHQIAVRVAWIFKTESVIMPAFLDAVDGQAWVRGWLPVLNNVCQSASPLMLSRQLSGASRRKWAMSASTVLMGLPFLALAGIWFLLDGSRPAWLPPAFLVLYSVFFATNGINVVSYTTLQGKLVRPERRGRLMGLAGAWGSVLAIAAAWLWLGPWLSRPDGGYGEIFLFTGAGFSAAGFLSLLTAEPATPRSSAGGPSESLWSSVAATLRASPGFRRLCVASMLCFSAQLLFPHYQALARVELGLSGRQMMWWVIAQNAGTGVFAWWIGRIADRSGNRRALVVQSYLSAATPLTALFLAYVSPEWGKRGYWIVFGLLGLTPVTLKTLLNYTLELTPPSEHTRSVATLRLCMGVWLCLSPVLGVLIESTKSENSLPDFRIAFVAVSMLLIGAGIWAGTLPDPRAVDGAGSQH